MNSENNYYQKITLFQTSVHIDTSYFYFALLVLYELYFSGLVFFRDWPTLQNGKKLRFALRVATGYGMPKMGGFKVRG